MTRKSLPTLERIRELFSYDPETGLVTRRVTRKMGRAGDVVGSAYKSRNNRTAYLSVSVDLISIPLHRMIFFYMTGRWPKLIDHINGVGTDNRWKNLREATHAENAWNSHGYAKCGLKGAAYDKREQRWKSSIVKHGQYYWLGYFDSAESAHAAYTAKARELFGAYARHQ